MSFELGIKFSSMFSPTLLLNGHYCGVIFSLKNITFQPENLQAQPKTKVHLFFRKTPDFLQEPAQNLADSWNSLHKDLKWNLEAKIQGYCPLMSVRLWNFKDGGS